MFHVRSQILLLRKLSNPAKNTCRCATALRQLSNFASTSSTSSNSFLQRARLGLPRTLRRTLNTGPNPILSSIANSDSRFRISYTVAVLVALGLGATGWGLYEFLAMLTVWPEEVRGDLRAGLRAKGRGDIKLSQRHLMRAWQTVQNIPTSKLEPDPYLKISGVAVVLAETFEEDGRIADAYVTLASALGLLVPRFKSFGELSEEDGVDSTNSRVASTVSTKEDVLKIMTVPSTNTSSPSSNAPISQGATSTTPSRYSLPASPSSRKRAVALALKLADLAETLQRPPAEEAFLSFAVEEVMRLVHQDNVFDMALERGVVEEKEKAVEKEGNDLELPLPSWATLSRTEVAAPMERLASFYARQGKDGYALVLYNGALKLLLPPSLPSGRTILESCQALQIFSAQLALLAELYTLHPEDPYPSRTFMDSTKRALSLYGSAFKASGGTAEGPQKEDMALCEDVYPAILYNAAVFHEGRGELDVALQFFARSIPRLQKNGSPDQVYEAQAGLRRVKRELERKQAAQT